MGDTGNSQEVKKKNHKKQTTGVYLFLEWVLIWYLKLKRNCTFINHKMYTFDSLIIKGDIIFNLHVIGAYDFIIVYSTTNNRILMQNLLINRWCQSSVERRTQTKFHSSSRHYEKNSNIRTTSHGTCCEVNVIQSKWWRDKLFLELSFYELSVIKNDIFSVFHSLTKSNAGAHTITLR